jgi:hypothetical protein
MTRRAGVARRKGRGHKGPTVKQRQQINWNRDNVAMGTLKGQTFGKRRRAQPECNNVIRNRDLKERLLLGSRRTLNKTFKLIVRLDIMK